MIKPNSQGDIFIVDENGLPICIATVKHGISYSIKAKTRKVVRVTIQPCSNFVTDELFFIPGEKSWELAYQHLMSRDILPELQKTYLVYFSQEEDYSPQAFIEYVIQSYFVKELSYQLPAEKLQSN